MYSLVRSGLRELAYGDLEDTVFQASRMDHVDYAFLLERYPRILSLAVEARKKGVSAREVFFGLSGLPITRSGPLADVWRETVNSRSWRKMTRTVEDGTGMAAAIESLLSSLLRDDRGERDPDDMPGEIDETGETGEPVLELKAIEGIPTNDEQEKAVGLVRLLGCLKGGIDSSDPQTLIDEVMAIASKIDMRGFDAMLGWASRVVRGASRRTRGGTSEMTGYSRGAWSERTLPQEQLAVARGDLEALIRFAENGLIERRYESWKPMGKGPVVLLRDETGSMANSPGKADYSMLKHKQALSFEVVLAEAFNKDGRDLITVAWGTDTLREYVWGDPAYSLRDHLTSFLAAYDTLIHRALVRGLEIVEDYVDGADILVVTDGALSDSSRVRYDTELNKRLDEFRDRGGRVWVVLVEPRTKSAQSWTRALPFADAVVSLSELQAGNADLGAVLDGMAARTTSKKRTIG